MFGELPKLFDRNFAIGYFLPVLVFIGLGNEIASLFYIRQSIFTILETNALTWTSIVFITAWLGGIALLVTNRGLIRFLEGYGKLNPLKLIAFFEKRKFFKLQKSISILDEEYRKCIGSNKEFSPEQRIRRNYLMQEMAIRFPDKESLLLPTSFGNTLRAFEVYPRVMYGIEAIDCWSRLQAIMPKDYRDLVDNAKVQVDFWVNVGLLSLILTIEFLVLASSYYLAVQIWIPFVLLGVAIISPHFATEAAVDWGDYVKASFDIYLPGLREVLKLEFPVTRDREKELWTAFSQAIIYMKPNRMPEIKQQMPDQDDNEAT